jgi:hypothetical protein
MVTYKDSFKTFSLSSHYGTPNPSEDKIEMGIEDGEF